PLVRRSRLVLVSGHTEVRTQEIPVPEPDLTPEAVIERARALIPAVRAQQDEAERLGHHTAELDRQFTEAGFYRILQPRRFGGYVVSGTWAYCSASAHASHFMCNAMVAGTTDRVTAVMPMDQVTVLDDWGDGATLGMNSSGSNSVRVEGVFVPAHRTAPADWTHGETMAPGAALHGPLYCGRIYALYHAGLVIPVIGAARAALDEYEQIIKTK